MKLSNNHRCNFLVFIILLLTSCGTGNANITKSYLNFNYKLTRAGDIHGLEPTSNEVLDRNPGFVSYIDRFNRDKSFITFNCKGTSYDDFYCEASFVLVDYQDNVLVQKESFRCSYVGKEWGTIAYDNNEDYQYLGTIYVYTPYWCRWQMECEVDNSGEKKLITFEFWKYSYNSLPEFITN